MKPKNTLRSFLAAIGASIIAISFASAQNGTWNQTALGTYSWDTAGNWVSDTIATGTDNTATFGNLSGAQTVTIDTARTIGNIDYNGSNNHILTIGGDATLTMAVTPDDPPIIPTINTQTRSITITSGLAGNQGLLRTGSGALTFSTTAPTFTGGLTLAGGNTVLNVAMTSIGGAGSTITATANSQLEMSGGAATNLDNSIHINDNVTFTHRRGQNATTTIKGVVSGGDTTTLSLTDAGGTFVRALILENTANTFTGAIDITKNNAGIIVGSLGDSVGAGNINFGNNNGGFALGSTAIAPMSITNRQFTMTAGGTAQIQNQNADANNTLTINSNLLMTGDTGAKTLLLGGNNTGMNTIAGIIANDGLESILNLTKANAGKWILGGANTYNGITTVSAGILEIGGSGTLGNVSAGVGDYAGNISITNTSSGRLVYNSTATQTLGGVISGAGAVFVEDGTLDLTNDNTYTGATTVNGGTLLINGSTSTSVVSVSSGATLGGEGTVGGATTINGGTLSPGNSPGTLTFANNLTLNNGSTYLFEAGDLTAVTGTLDLNTNWTLSLGSGFQDGGTVTLFTYGTLAASPDLDPTFFLANLGFTPSGALTVTDDLSGSIILNGISVIPEPGAALLGSLGLLMLLRRRR